MRGNSGARRINDVDRNLAIAFSVDLEVLSPAGGCNRPERFAIQRRTDTARHSHRRRLSRFRWRLGNQATEQCSDADDVDRNRASPGVLERSRHLAAPGLTVRDENEQPGIFRLSAELFVLVDQSKPPVDAELDVGVPCRVILEPEWRLFSQMIEEEEERVWIASQANLWCGHVSEHRQRDPIVSPTERFTEDTKKPHRSLPAVPPDVTYVHRGESVLKDHDIDAARTDA